MKNLSEISKKTFEKGYGCPICFDTGKIPKLEHVSGLNIQPGGFYEVNGDTKCPFCNIDDYEE
jgi:hypothetical protein